jgi:hypothetical protein
VRGARGCLVLAGIVAGGVGLPTASQANTILQFGCLTQNDPGDCTVGETQFSVTLTDEGGGVVRFHFKNAGPAASVLSEIYFDDGALLALSNVIDGPGVDFEPDANPPDLPGGEDAVPPFQVTQGFLAQSTPSPAQNGAGPTEWVAIEFTLQDGKTIADVISDLTTGQLRIGIHVIGFGSGGSESFVNHPVPEPTAVTLLGCGLVGVAALRRASGRASGRRPARTRTRPIDA